MFARRDDDEPAVAQGARISGTPALMSSRRGNKHMEVGNRNFSAAINIRRHAVPKTRLAEQSLRLEMCKDELKPIAIGWSRRATMRLRASVCIPSMVVER